MDAPKTILVATDLSQRSHAALKETIEIARKAHAKICLLHVVDDKIFQRAAEYGVAENILDKIAEVNIKNVKTKIMRDIDGLRVANEIDIVTEVKRGVPAEVILEEQKKMGAELIVLGRKEGHGLIGKLRRSIAGRIVKESDCRVMIAKTA